MATTIISFLDSINRRFASSFVDITAYQEKKVASSDVSLEHSKGKDRILTSVYPSKEVQEELLRFLFER